MKVIDITLDLLDVFVDDSGLIHGFGLILINNGMLGCSRFCSAVCNSPETSDVSQRRTCTWPCVGRDISDRNLKLHKDHKKGLQ